MYLEINVSDIFDLLKNSIVAVFFSRGVMFDKIRFFPTNQVHDQTYSEIIKK
jgi:hypothetical protein